ncbi:GOLPH3/VPS74 family protein [Amnibacterium endophyticum]|uniref:GPP34 family phosphoprotein n=1 Tax=Amnibacterium endophyticum TaxID=2109337 RepID=A0ABW4LA06_9MICO
MTLIAEDLLLLLLDDDAGTLPGLWTDVRVPLGAALLADLRLAGAVRAGEPLREDGVPLLPTGRWPSPTVLAEDGARVDDPLLVDALAVVTEEPRTADDLASVLGDGLVERLTDRLVDAGVLERHESKVLGFIPRTRWPAIRTEGEARVRDALRAALVDGAEPDERTRATAALLQALDRVPRTLGLHGAEARDARDRATVLAEDDWPSRTVRDAIAEAATATTLGGGQPGMLLP